LTLSLSLVGSAQLFVTHKLLQYNLILMLILSILFYLKTAYQESNT